MISRLINLSVPRKRLITIAYDAFAAPLALWVAWSLRLGEFVDLYGHGHFIVATILTTITAFILSGYYRVILSRIGTEIVYRSLQSVGLATLFLALYSFLYGNSGLPRTVVFIYGLALLILCLGSRVVAYRLLKAPTQAKQRVAIYGTGESGVQLLGALQQSEKLHPYLFLDDNSERWGSDIAGLRVYSPDEFPALSGKHNIREVIIAITDDQSKHRREMLDRFADYPVRVRLLPPISELAQGKVNIESLHEIRVEDLLDRTPTPPDQELLSENIHNKAVMVTGAGGSIGAELCYQTAKLGPSCLIMVEQSEHALYQINRTLDNDRTGTMPVKKIPVLGSVCDPELMTDIIKRYQVQTIYHAAAYKHVPLVEKNVAAGVRNNTFGTKILTDAAIAGGVDTFVLISTDKAVLPTSVMGRSKRLAEMILQARADEGTQTKFCAVRFGNVLDSSGSVVPLFREQIRERKPITLTHSDMTRYFMTIDEAVTLVIQAGAMSEGGEVFVLNMGEPVKIDDLARKMIRLSGLQVRDARTPGGDIEIIYMGVRPGEKLNEVLFADKPLTGTDHRNILCSRDDYMPWSELSRLLDRLQSKLSDGDSEIIACLNAVETMDARAG